MVVVASCCGVIDSQDEIDIVYARFYNRNGKVDSIRVLYDQGLEIKFFPESDIVRIVAEDNPVIGRLDLKRKRTEIKDRILRRLLDGEDSEDILRDYPFREGLRYTSRIRVKPEEVTIPPTFDILEDQLV